MTDSKSRPGLSADAVLRARHEHGLNELPQVPPPPIWQAILRQFTSPLIVILALAVVAAALLGETIDAMVIAAVIVLNAVLGFVQEWRAEKALAALTNLLSPLATVRRDGVEERIPAAEVVPGDLLVLSTGDRVAADGNLVVSRDAELNESILTGESMPVPKVEDEPVFAGTSLVVGTAEAEVTATGSNTSFAEIAKLTGGIDRRPTQLQQALGRLAWWLGIFSIGVGVAVASLGLLTGQPILDMMLTAISLAVAMVPEGLPAVVTITLALGASAMVRRKALVRRMQAIETLGAASVICTDKTGTLTENKMVATRFWLAGSWYDAGCDAIKDITAKNQSGVIQRFIDVASICTHASRYTDQQNNVQSLGSPTEVALLELVQQLGEAQAADVQEEMPFSSERKRMAMLVERDGCFRLLVKGAPEVVLEKCAFVAMSGEDKRIDAELRKELNAVHESMAAQGLRVLALADRAATQGNLDDESLVLLGFVGLIDPPRQEVPGAIVRARDAGIRVIMVTGDSPVTARAISGQMDLPADKVVTGKELAAISDADLAPLLKRDVIFARTRPADKLRLVTALQSTGAVVAMTGDGVNDAPALKRADIGVAMGQRGTDVAQEAADLILLDDNFTTIVNAVAEGRRQFANIKKFVRYLLSSNAGEVVALVANLIIGGPLIFLATQILWMNLITDGVTAVALGLEKSEPDQMKQPPRKPTEPILGRAGFLMILGFGLYTGGASLFLFYKFLPVDPVLANTLAFTAMVVFEKMSVFAFRSFRTPVTTIGWGSNKALLLALLSMLALQVMAVYLPFFQAILHTVPLDILHWQWIVALALPLIIVAEGIKMLMLTSQPKRGIVRTQTDTNVHGTKP
ncbi:MAG: cation-transporting P-type ATPase [Pseudomonadota bacterium]